MRLRESLEAVAAISPEAFEDLGRDVDPEWILQALEATGTATFRTRRLPAEQVVWLVIGMALFRNRSIHDIVSKLDLALPAMLAWNRRGSTSWRRFGSFATSGSGVPSQHQVRSPSICGTSELP